MEAALDELTELFSYRSFHLLDTVLVRTTADAGRAGVNAPLRDGGAFRLSFDTATVIYGEPKHLVRFENLHLAVDSAEIEIRTNVEIREGHKVLIGKSSIRGSEANPDLGDLVLVIEARLKETWAPDTGD